MANNAIYFSKKRILTPIFLIFLGLSIFAFIIAGSFLLEKNFLLRKKKFFYLPPPDYLKALSGSFRTFCADIFYIRGVMAITEEVEDRNFWVDWVQSNFELATTLDPKLTQGYFFAGVVISLNQQEIRKGIQFLERGLKQNPNLWQIPYWIGFDYYQLGDYLKAAEYYQKASQLAGAPNFLKSNPAVLYYRGARPDLGLLYLEGLAHSIKDPIQLGWIKTKLQWLQDIVYLEERVRQFKALYGYCPEKIDILKEKGLLKEIPQDPFGKGYYLDRDTCRIKSKFSLSKEEKD